MPIITAILLMAAMFVGILILLALIVNIVKLYKLGFGKGDKV